MNRREILIAGAGATVAIPFLDAADWKPALFTAQQNETVVALIDVLIPATDTPGAKAANVNRYVDLLLADGPAPERERFMSGLKWLDDAASKEHGAAFAKLSLPQQIALLKSMEAGAGEGHEFFRLSKSMTVRLYYQTEEGFKELNKHGVPKSFGCQHSGQHA